MKIAKVDAQAGAAAQGDASLEGAEFAIVNASGTNSFVNGHSYADGDAMLMAADSVVGPNELAKLTAKLPSSIELDRLHSKVERWKAKGE